MKKRLIALTFAAATASFAQSVPSDVPSTFQPVYSQLQGKLDSLKTTIDSQWNGQMGNSIYSSELLSANANSGIQLLTSGNRAQYLQELNALKGLGVQAVVVKAGFPFLYQPFLTFNGDPGDYPKVISYYQQVVTDVHAAGLKIIIESASLFPGFFSSNSGLNVSGYYQQLAFSDYLTGTGVMNNTIVTQIQPDFLNVGSEPDTEVANTGYTQLNTPAGWAQAVTAYQAMMPTPHPIPVGAGIGTWETVNGPAIITAILPLVDYIDIHIYPINDPAGAPVDFITNTLNVINQAETAGKRVAISEAWLLKVADDQYTSTGVASSVDNFSLDSYSFWAPLDQEFLTDFYDVANWKNLIYFSAFWSRYYWAYVDYNSVSGLQPQALITDSIMIASSALNGGQVTTTGSFVKSSLTTVPPLAIVNSASYNVHSVAPNSIMAVFGPSVATGTAGAGATLNTNLEGTTLTIKDSAGATAAADLFFASPTQLNALVPAGIAPGLATATLTNGSNATYVGTLNVTPSAPGLFSANGSGNGTAAAQVYTIQANGSAAFSPLPVNLSGGSSVYLVLYGTGIQGRSSLSNVSVTVNETALPVSYAGPQNGFSGLDQVNVLLPASLAGSGTVNVYLTVDGRLSNAVAVPIN